jgi:hypothetical protein
MISTLAALRVRRAAATVSWTLRSTLAALSLLPVATLISLGPAAAVTAKTLHGTPESYRKLIRQLKPGDTLLLAPGTYRDTLPLHRLAGSADAPIAIRGPRPPDEARFLGRAGANTVSVLDSSHLIIESVVIDGQGLPVDGVKAEGHGHYADHITLANLTIVNHDADQATVAISVHCPAWGWVIRDNVIDGAGTGMYLGGSDGGAPFVGGLIEGNVVRNTLGYSIQLKHQKPRPSIAGMPLAPQVTIVRRNTLIKSGRGSTGADARPNLLLGHFPLSGPGSADRYLVYGNLFFDNPAEALFQGEGNLAVYNNLFVNPHGDAVNIRPHNDRPREVLLFGNTIVARRAGLRLAGIAAETRMAIEANAIFADEPVATGVAADHSSPERIASRSAESSAGERPWRRAIDDRNLVAGFARAGDFLVSPAAADLARLDLAPRSGALRGAPPLAAILAALPEFDLDYRGMPRTVAVYGACAPGLPCRPR